MAKFHGFIGFATMVETAPGVYQEQIDEREYRGDFLRTAQKWSTAEKLNDDIQLDARVSIIADPFAFANMSTIRYVKFDGVAWRVSSIEHERPRLILKVGGVYNG